MIENPLAKFFLRSPYEQIKWICFLILTIFVFGIADDIDLLKTNLGLAGAALSVKLFIAEKAYFVLMLILFWKAIRAGWILLSCYLSFKVFSAAFELFVLYNRGDFGASGFYLSQLLFFSILFWVICRRPIREIFNVGTKLVLLAILLPIIGMILLAWPTD